MYGGNPFFSTPGFAQGAGALARLFIPDAGREAALQAREAQGRLYDTQAEEIQQRIAANPQAAEALSRGDLAGAYVAWARGGSAPVLQAAPGFVRGYGAAAGVDGNRLSDLFVGAGGSEANTPRGFAAAQDTTRRGQDLSASTQRYGYDQSRAGALEREQLQEAGRDRRMAPEISNNATVVVPPNSPLATRADPQGRIEGPRVQTGAGAGANRPPLDVGGGDAKAIDEQIAANLPEGTALDGQAAAAVRTRAADLYQQTRNLPLAVKQAMDEFLAQNPPRVDNRLNPFSDRRLTVPQAGGAAPAQAAPAAAIPPPEQRERDKVYPTPRGPMIWTGTGWRPAS